MKKTVTLLTVVSLLLCLLLSACSAPAETSSDATKAPVATAAAATKAPDSAAAAAPEAAAEPEDAIPTFPLAETLNLKVYSDLSSKFAGATDNLGSLVIFDVIRDKCNVNFTFEHASESIAAEQ